MAKESSPAGSGISLSSLLTVVFVVLKLTHVIDWSWLWVLSPLWISFGVALVVLIPVVLISRKL